MVRRIRAGVVAAGCLFAAAAMFPQDGGDDGAAAEAADMAAATTIPEALRRPRRGEAGRYPVDTVIGPLGPGDAGADAYLVARDLLGALVAGNRGSPALSAAGDGALDAILEALRAIDPVVCRLGGGRREADGAVSFLVRFIGREKGIVGELYLRTDEEEPAAEDAAAGEDARPGDGAADGGGGRGGGKAAVWYFDDLVLEEPGDRGAPAAEGRFDFVPYERVF
jgi:hypothetical protein